MSSPFIKSFTEHLLTIGSIKVDLYANNRDIIAIHEKLLYFILLTSITKNATLKPDQANYRCIYIHEDLWFNQRDIMVSRINQVLGLNQKIAARMCFIKSVDKIESEKFLNQNHLLGSCLAAFRIGLFYKNEIVAIGTFSKSRVMIDGDVYYRSFEMLRFAVKMNYSVTGGLGKILKYFIQTKNVVHLMTYIDNEWGAGEAFLQLGFKATTKTESQSYWLDPITLNRFKSNDMPTGSNVMIEKKNLGSTKLILDLRPNGN